MYAVDPTLWSLEGKDYCWYFITRAPLESCCQSSPKFVLGVQSALLKGNAVLLSERKLYALIMFWNPPFQRTKPCMEHARLSHAALCHAACTLFMYMSPLTQPQISPSAAIPRDETTSRSGAAEAEVALEAAQRRLDALTGELAMSQRTADDAASELAETRRMAAEATARAEMAEGTMLSLQV